MSAFRGRRSPDGFTLVEMLLVVIIIGILAGMIVTSLSGRGQEARIARARADIAGSLAMALGLFEQDVGRYPTAEEGLRVLQEDPGLPGWKGPYLQTGLKPDPWGQDYVYSLDSRFAGRYVLTSAGPDGKPNTEDDVKS